MARDAGLSRVDNESDTNCSEPITIQVDSSAFSAWIRKMQHSEMLISPTPTRNNDWRKEADMGGVPITKVREQLRRVVDDESCYAPHCVPIGPYHLSRSSPWIEKTKQCSTVFLQSLAEEHTVGGLTGVMEKLEPLARACYTSCDRFGDMTPEQFSSMLLGDACYLLLSFVDYESGNNGAPPAPTDDGERPVSHSTLVRDTVFLLENQIPFFLLQAIHERVTGDTTSVLDYIAMPIQELLQLQHFINPKPRPPPPTCSHLLHLVHAYLRPTIRPTESTAMCSSTVMGRWRRAAEYRRYANVRFMRRDYQDDVESSVLDVQLERGTLWIPRLRINSNTLTILRNLMALEEQTRRRPVTAYCLFMSQLACTAEDVQLLRRAGIVDHFLGNDEQVSKDLAGLCKGVVIEVDDLDRNYLKPMWHQLEKRCDSRAQRSMGWFRHGQNWEIIAAFLVALILIACQVTQTLYAVAGGGH